MQETDAQETWAGWWLGAEAVSKRVRFLFAEEVQPISWDCFVFWATSAPLVPEKR